MKEQNRPFTGKCAICGREMKSPAYCCGEYHDVCPKCFNQRFWDLVVEHREEHLIVDGNCFSVGRESTPSRLRGFGGAAFKWVMLDDPTETVHVSTNVWHNGKIPESHRSQLPDNARWVRNEK